MENNNENIDWLFNMATAHVLKQYREKSGLSLEEVVQKMKKPISRQSLFKYENNLARIKNNTFIDICNVLDVDPDEAFSEISSLAMQYKYCVSNNMEPTFIDNDGKQKKINLYEIPNIIDETEILFDKYKDILTDDDKETIKFLIEKRKREIDKQLGEN